MLLFLHLIVLVAVNIEAKNIQLSLGSIDVESVTKSSQDSSHLDSVTKSLHSKSSQDTTGLLVTTLVDGIRPGSARSSIEVALYGCGGSIEAFLPPAAFLIYIPEKCEQVLQSISCIEGTVHLPSSLRSPLLSSAGSLNDLPIRIIRVDFVAGYLNELETTLQTILVTERVTIAPISAKSAVISALSLCEYASCTVDSQSDLCGNSCFLSNTLIETIASLTGVFWIERIQKHSTSNIHARAVTQTTDLVNWPGISQEYGLCGDVSTCAFKDDIPFSLLKSLYPTIGSTVSDNNNKTQSKSNNINYERINKPLRRQEIKKKKKKISKTAPSRPLTKMSSSIRSPSLPTIQDLLFNQETFSLKRSPSLPTRQRALLNQTDCTATCSGPACGLGYSSCGGFESPLNILGLDGTGQLIQVVDSGLDFNNPFFYDTAVAVNPSKLPPSGLSTHRKVVAYWSYMDALDELGGHGTHVAGSVAGNAAPVSSVDDSLMLDTLSGMAPGAKIYFTDVSCETPGGCTPPASIPTSCTQCSGDGLYVPLNIFDLFKPAYNIGSRISTNSWGGGFSVYSSLSADIDSYVVSRPDHLIIFAAGNDGAEAGFTSLSIQAVSKNVLSVGATRDGLLAHMIKINGFNDVSGGGYINPLFGQGTPKSCGGILRTAILYGLLPNEAPICETPTNDYCSQLSLDAFQVPFSVPGDISGSYLFSDGAFFDLPLCCGCTPKQIFDGFYALNLPTSFSSVLSYFETTYNARLASEFTSRGPTLDGRIKPDMVAPGVDIISARANGGVKYNSFKCASGSLNTTNLVNQTGLSLTGTGIPEVDLFGSILASTAFSTKEPLYIESISVFVYNPYQNGQIYLAITDKYLNFVTSISQYDSTVNDNFFVQFPILSTFAAGFEGYVVLMASDGFEFLTAAQEEEDSIPQCFGSLNSTLALQIFFSRGGAESWIMPMSGTSMATPVTAGNAALVRSYFTDGYYPTGTRNGTKGFFPSAALMKAILINSASPTIDADLALLFNFTGPSQNELYSEAGFGIASLVRGLSFKTLGSATRASGALTTLLLPGLSSSGVDPSITDEAVAIYCIDTVKPTSSFGNLPFSVTLVWTDPAASTLATTALVNDLDLEVTLPGSSTIYYGNVNPLAPVQRADRLNNVEKVTFSVPPFTLSSDGKQRLNSSFRVIVRGASIIFGPQNYSLVVTGSGVILSDSSSCGGDPFAPEAIAGASEFKPIDLIVVVSVLSVILVIMAGWSALSRFRVTGSTDSSSTVVSKNELSTIVSTSPQTTYGTPTGANAPNVSEWKPTR